MEVNFNQIQKEWGSHHVTLICNDLFFPAMSPHCFASFSCSWSPKHSALVSCLDILLRWPLLALLTSLWRASFLSLEECPASKQRVSMICTSILCTAIGMVYQPYENTCSLVFFHTFLLWRHPEWMATHGWWRRRFLPNHYITAKYSEAMWGKEGSLHWNHSCPLDLLRIVHGCTAIYPTLSQKIEIQQTGKQTWYTVHDLSSGIGTRGNGGWAVRTPTFEWITHSVII